MLHLARLAAAERAGSRLDSLFRRALALNAAPQSVLEIGVLRTVLAADEDVLARFGDELERAGDAAISGVATSAAVYTGDIDAGIRLLRLSTARDRPRERRALAHVQIAYLEMARGRWRRAEAELDEAAQIHPVVGVELAALLAAQAFVPASRQRLLALRDALAGRSPADAPEADIRFIAALRELHPHLHPYLLGLLSLRLGDVPGVRRHAEELERMPVLRGGYAKGELLRELRARLAHAEGEPESALRGARVPLREVAEVGPVPTHGSERYAHAELLFTSGKDSEALAWFSTFEHGTAFEHVFVAPAHLQRGELLERMGERARAAEHYARFLELWRDADPELRPLVERARQRLGALRGA